jgi:hypothetical protein
MRQEPASAQAPQSEPPAQACGVFSPPPCHTPPPNQKNPNYFRCASPPSPTTDNELGGRRTSAAPAPNAERRLRDMLTTRIKNRAYSFATWLVSILLLLVISFSFLRHAVCWNSSKTLGFASGTFWLYIMPSRELGPRAESFQWNITPIKNRQPVLNQMIQLFSWPYRNKASCLMVPLGSPVVILLVVSSWRFWRRMSPSVGCQKCGYNLQGNTSGTCPECGIKIEPSRIKA